MATQTKYRGVVVPMVSPFTADGGIDEPSATRLMAHLIDGGIPGVFVLGTTGESMSIHPRERARLVECAAKAAAGRATLYAGISGNCLRESIESAKQYRDLGANALVVHPPFYYPISDANLEAYFRGLADAVSLPLLLYNIPQTTHVSIPIEVVVRLAEHPNIAGIKDSGPQAQRMTDLLGAVGGRERFCVHAGFSGLFTHALKLGVDGLVPSGANLEPKPYVALFEAAQNRQWDQVQKLQEQTDAISARYVSGRLLSDSLAMLKHLLAQQGLCGRAVLPPLRPVEAASS
jgi:4-hydroxy-tetrahydrodipicolinate synthase